MDNQDKFAERKNMIDHLMHDPLYVPMKEKELAMLLQVGKDEREELHAVLQALMDEGRIMVTTKGKYQIGDGSVVTGTFISNERGFGFVEVPDREDDIFIPESKTKGAFLNDRVLVRLGASVKGKRQEGEIVKILEHTITTVVGIYDKADNFGFVIPDNHKIGADIFVPKERSKGAMDGHKVVCEITSYGNGKNHPEGKIVEILGHVNDPGVDILSIVKGFGLPMEFPEKVMQQAERIPEEVSEADRAGRRDLRNVTMVTIDGEDAKDLDDAVSLSWSDDHYFLGVHIADVTNYVQENSALDWEAFERGTSVYLVDRVIPMLPHRLSNGVCSLNMGVDRLALSCLMTIDKKGQIVDYEIMPSVICVDQRMSYTSVKKILEDHDPEEITKYEALVPMFEKMEELSGLLRQRRYKRGAADFDFPESKIILDEEGAPIEIKAYERNVATKIIEDFMLAANETVAEHFFWTETPFVYRTHDKPDPDKVKKLSAFISHFGYHIKVSGEEVHPKEYQKLLKKVEGTPEEALISRLTLRSMKQARYSPECSGHFGLACKYYCHFTSPIRRYPDLQIHRIIKEQLRGKLDDKRISHYKDKLPLVSKQSSERERRAEEAERETVKLKKVAYMENHLGDVFDGIISGVTSWGVYVEMSNTVEGMIRVSDLPYDFYEYDENAYSLTGKDSGRRYCIGQPMRVRVIRTNVFEKTIDLEEADE